MKSEPTTLEIVICIAYLIIIIVAPLQYMHDEGIFLKIKVNKTEINHDYTPPEGWEIRTNQEGLYSPFFVTRGEDLEIVKCFEINEGGLDFRYYDPQYSDPLNLKTEFLAKKYIAYYLKQVEAREWKTQEQS